VTRAGLAQSATFIKIGIMPYDGLKPLLPARTIHQRVKELGQEITDDYRGQSLVVLALLDGACCFVADLVRCLELPELRLHFVRASSYGAGTRSSGKVALEPLPNLDGQHVLLVDDILDTGRTLQAARANLNRSTVHTCVLLDKPTRRVPDGLQVADYIGFTIPDTFVVGYGLDHAGRYRHLPDICVLTHECRL
jgi:hypoxanthine phosphoribosyltransferase